jgi:hypothetical protein
MTVMPADMSVQWHMNIGYLSNYEVKFAFVSNFVCHYEVKEGLWKQGSKESN